ncbi:hypothetical protein WJX73_009360 [Symbiochloris irregularis]|uniref:Translation initiation factor IF-3 n=1 Tax=Symbiochloris irregularis TaxID=706552 RepID=A0AAW1PQL3_9CHLO
MALHSCNFGFQKRLGGFVARPVVPCCSLRLPRCRTPSLVVRAEGAQPPRPPSKPQPPKLKAKPQQPASSQGPAQGGARAPQAPQQKQQQQQPRQPQQQQQQPRQPQQLQRPAGRSQGPLANANGQPQQQASAHQKQQPQQQQQAPQQQQQQQPPQQAPPKRSYQPPQNANNANNSYSNGSQQQQRPNNGLRGPPSSQQNRPAFSGSRPQQQLGSRGPGPQQVLEGSTRIPQRPQLGQSRGPPSMRGGPPRSPQQMQGMQRGPRTNRGPPQQQYNRAEDEYEEEEEEEDDTPVVRAPPTEPAHGMRPGVKGIKANAEIEASEVRLLAADKSQLGIVSIREAIKMATEQEADVIMISSDTAPPVCRLVSIDKYKYEQAKVDRDAKRKQRENRQDLKELKLRPATDVHDYQVRLRSAQKFLSKGDKVKVTLNFKGREISLRDGANDMMRRFISDLGDQAVTLQDPAMQGRALVMTLGPNKK